MRYEGNIFRPFSEANSYLLQCTIGCSHNSCTFCGMYKDRKYRVRSLEEIKEDIRMAREHYDGLEKVFLCDGDAIAMETDMLLAILAELKKSFTSLRHVGTYVGPASTLAKSAGELEALRSAGLTKAYLGVETGDNDLLKKTRKGVTSDEMLQAGRNLIDAGINLSSMVLLGLAGKGPGSEAHIRATAKITNEMKPHYLAALTVTPVPGTALHRQVEEGSFTLLDPMETLVELRMLIDGLSVDNLKFVGMHASNYLPVNGTLQRDKGKMLDAIDAVLREGDMSRMRAEGMRGL